MRSSGAGTSNEIPLQESGRLSAAILITLPILFIAISCFEYKIIFPNCTTLMMALNSSLNSIDSDVFYVEQSSSDQSLPRPNTPIVLNSTEISGDESREMISISSIASPEPQIVTIDDDSNEPTMPYGFGQQLPIVPPSLNDLNLPPNPFNILATMAVVTPTHDDNYSPQSPEPSELSSISTPPPP